MHTCSGVRSDSLVCIMLYVLLLRPDVEEGVGGGEKTFSQCQR